jgi:hypothetical protein
LISESSIVATGEEMHTLTVLLITAGLLLGWRWYARVGREVKAANNAVAAKLTFAQLDGPTQAAVVGQALSICHQLLREPRDLAELSEPQQLLLASLAMYELGIPPALSYMKTWNVVRNPFLAIRPNSRTLEMVAKAVSDSEGVELTIDQRDPWAERIVSKLPQKS